MTRQPEDRMGSAFSVRDRIASTTIGLFRHADYPLAHSLDYPGDAGLFGPGSATWEVVGDIAVMVGGIRSLLVQAAHPEVAAGVAEHSTYETDPLGRLSRTTSYVTATAYGALPEIEAALTEVRRAHKPVSGTSHRGRRYSAGSGSGAAWVHNALADSFLTAFDVFGPGDLDPDRADQFAQEQSKLGALLHASELPVSRDTLALWIDSHPDLGPSPAMTDTVNFLAHPPLPVAARAPYQILFRAAAATLPPRISRILGVRTLPGAVAAGVALTGLLRWSIGSSSTWWLALERVGAEAPSGVTFRFPPPVDGIEDRFSQSTN